LPPEEISYYLPVKSGKAFFSGEVLVETGAVAGGIQSPVVETLFMELPCGWLIKKICSRNSCRFPPPALP